tara:strand:- start:22183 stop:22824 length:642 start_codon:yes stop_codon:yes gene_type:complete
MADLYLLNKPFKVLSQFTDSDGRSTLANFVNIKGIYPAGRLDYDSEGLLILTSEGDLQARIADPKYKLSKTYWVQLEGIIDDHAISHLASGVLLKDGLTRPAKVKRINEPNLWPRTPPIRFRKDDHTSWIELTISEGRNRQVRRMTAEVGYPTLRLIRYSIGPWKVEDIQPGTYKKIEVNLPQNKTPSKIQNKKHYNNPKAKSKRINIKRHST